MPARRNAIRAIRKVPVSHDCLREEAVFLPAQKCPYHVTFDLDLDLEHILDAGSPVDHRVQVWSQSSHLPARKGDFRSSTKVPVSRDL